MSIVKHITCSVIAVSDSESYTSEVYFENLRERCMWSEADASKTL